MKQYLVYFKNGKESIFSAYSYTERAGKYFLHKKEDKSDFESFVVISEVVAIEEQPEESPLGEGF